METFSATKFLVAFQLIAPLTMVLTESVSMPAECGNLHYCTFKGIEYPDKYIKKLNDNNKLPRMVKKMGGTRDIGHRQGDPTDATGRMCPSKSNYTAVYYIVDENKKTRVVVQLADVFEQKFELRACEKPGPVTEVAGQVIREDIHRLKLYCENIYYKFEFFVLSDDMTRLEKAYSMIGVPVFCACRYNFSKEIENADFS